MSRSIKKLPTFIHKNGLYKECLERTDDKCLYECRNKDNEVFYQVFVNLIKPIPLQFWPVSLYDFEEIYPSLENSVQRMWSFHDINQAKEKYDSLNQVYQILLSANFNYEKK